MKKHLDECSQKLDKLTRDCMRSDTNNGIHNGSQLFDPDTTLVITGLNKPISETKQTLTDTCKKLLTVIDPTRTPALINTGRIGDKHGRDGVVKMQFDCIENKVSVLRGKRRLQESPVFSNVFIKAAKSHDVMLIEQNFKTLLSGVPGLQELLAVNTSGKLVPQRKTENQHTRHQQLYPPFTWSSSTDTFSARFGIHPTGRCYHETKGS